MINGDGTFNGQLLVDKLAKLNNSQQSIETLSHWCIFHRKKAKQVVETWERQFHCSPRDQRVSFLYLANDILQNSRRKGLEFVGEYWKVLPTALKDVIENGDEFGKKAALRLVDIWEERKVFGSGGQVLKEELLGNRNRSGKNITYKLKSPNGEMREKLISSYEQVNDGLVDEDVLFGKCRAAISFIEKLEKDSGTEFNIGSIGGPTVLPELQLQHGLLKECIQQLQLAESSRATLLSHLREALHEQEFMVEQVRNQLEAAQSRYDQVKQVLVGKTVAPPSDQQLNEVPPPPPPSAFSEVPPPPDYPPDSPTRNTTDMALSTSIHYAQKQPEEPLVDITSPQTTSEEHRSSAAEVAAKLTASTSSAQMLSFVLSSLASEGVIGQSMSEEYYSDSSKRPRLNSAGLSGVPCYMPQPQQPPPPLFPHPDSLLQPLPPPLLPSLAPITPLAPPGTAPQFVQTSGSLTGVPYTYGTPLPPPSQLPPYPIVGMPPYPGPPNPYHFQGSDNGVVFAHQPLMAAPPPMSRQ